MVSDVPLRALSGHSRLRENGRGGDFLSRPRLFLLLNYGGESMPSAPQPVLSKAELQLIELIRSLDYGELRVLIKDKRPIRVEEIRRSIQLDGGK